MTYHFIYVVSYMIRELNIWFPPSGLISAVTSYEKRKGGGGKNEENLTNY